MNSKKRSIWKQINFAQNYGRFTTKIPLPMSEKEIEEVLILIKSI